MNLGRRELLGLAIGSVTSSRDTRTLGCALLLDIVTNKILIVTGREQAREWLITPGSIVKPISLWALLQSKKVDPAEAIPCRRNLRLAGLNMGCSHPRLPFPVDVTGAIAYSCNYTTAYFARRFADGELAGCYGRAGFESTSGLGSDGEAAGSVEKHVTGERLQLQAIGERGLRVTPLEIARAYRQLASLARTAQFEPVLRGMEGAVQFGTAQAAQVHGQSVAGKTGSVRMENGLHSASFAGFAPSRDPKVVVTVVTQGRSGAESAAPIAGQMLRQYFSA